MTKGTIAVIDASPPRALKKCADLLDLLNQLRTKAVERTGLPFGSILFQIEKNSEFHHAFTQLRPDSSFNFELVDKVCRRKHEFYLIIDDSSTHKQLRRGKNKKVCFYSTEWATS